jgi:hypothetical protein
LSDQRLRHWYLIAWPQRLADSRTPKQGKCLRDVGTARVPLKKSKGTRRRQLFSKRNIDQLIQRDAFCLGHRLGFFHECRLQSQGKITCSHRFIILRKASPGWIV